MLEDGLTEACMLELLDRLDTGRVTFNACSMLVQDVLAFFGRQSGNFWMLPVEVLLEGHQCLLVPIERLQVHPCLPQVSAPSAGLGENGDECLLSAAPDHESPSP